MRGFQEYRNAAPNGIVAAGGEPILAEDFDSLPVSSRNACLDAVASCDALVVIVGGTGGSLAPSGKLVVEEEYEEALKRRLPILTFIQDTHRDENAERFVKTLSDYTDGLFRTTFVGPSDLEALVCKAVQRVTSHWRKPCIEAAMIEQRLKTPYAIHTETSIRFVLAPERVGELIDPLRLEAHDFHEELFRIGHSREVRLFSYQHAKRVQEVSRDQIVILQWDDGGRHDEIDEVRLELTTHGVLTIDANVTGYVLRGDRSDLTRSMDVIEDDVVGRLTACFAFGCHLMQRTDPYKRYDRMFYNAALSGIGSRALVKEPRRGSCTIGFHGDEIVIAYPQPRIVSRWDLANPAQEATRTLAMFRRQLRQS
jgi:hypothetical protein